MNKHAPRSIQERYLDTVNSIFVAWYFTGVYYLEWT